MVLKSFNFKLYYTPGGAALSNKIIKEAESHLETMENFLGTRLVEKIDIFLSEKPVNEEKSVAQRNGNIILDNSSIYLFYSGNTKDVIAELKEQLAEILINGLLYGNTIKERLKNNREINVPDWYVPGLAKYVAATNKPQTGWMADYYEDKLKLNLNLTDKNDLAEFGHAVFIYISDSFGINKLRQLLFYTKLSGKTEYAFQYVLNKSLNWVIADWFKLEKDNYLKANKSQLPNDPEPLSGYLQTADIIDVKFNKEGDQLDFLIRTLSGIELWNYNIAKQISKKIFRYTSVNNNLVWAFVNIDNDYYLTSSSGSVSHLMMIQKGKVVKNSKLNFNYIYTLKEHPVKGIVMLVQKKYQMDLVQLEHDHKNSLTNITNDMAEETDFVYQSNGDLYISVYADYFFKIINSTTGAEIFKSSNPPLKLKDFSKNYISLIQFNTLKNYGVILNPKDSLEVYQVTNYTRSILNYDYNTTTNKLMEGLKYGKKNYLVISDATLERIKLKHTDTNKVKPSANNDFLDTSNIEMYAYKFVTGFEYKKKSSVSIAIERKPELNIQFKIKEFTAPSYEFKPRFIGFGFTNTTFNSPLFASFFPVRAGIYNGPHIIAGCGISDINKEYSFVGHIRQPLRGKGTDLDFLAKAVKGNTMFGLFMFQSVYQREIYNQTNKYYTRELRFFVKVKWHPKIASTSQVGYRQDLLMPLSLGIENLQRKIVRLQQPFVTNNLEWNVFQTSRLNYSQKFVTNIHFDIYKPLKVEGLNTNILLNIKHDQSFARLFHLSTRLNVQSSVGKQKTVWLLGGVSNWLKPLFANAPVYNPESVVMYSTTPDFAGLPYNYRSGTSSAIGKIILSIPVNPIISQQNFNHNFFKFLTVHSFANIGLAWYGRNPFSINNPENREVIETGSITITNYVGKNPLVWSFGAGANSVLFGYEVGFEHAIGYNEQGKIGKFNYITIGKEF